MGKLNDSPTTNGPHRSRPLGEIDEQGNSCFYHDCKLFKNLSQQVQIYKIITIVNNISKHDILRIYNPVLFVQ